MKRILSTILLCVTILCAYSQEDITLFFLNDGSFKGFYDEEIDSITYSHLDLDSVWHSDAVVQEVWLADSVVRIPIEKIDSICHKVPNPEYKPGVIHLDERYLPYITSVDGLTISFSSGLSENLLPKEGSVLLYEGSNNIFPNGFAGTVTKLVDGVAVCDSAAVDDVYERLYFFGSYVLAEDGEGTGTYSAKKIRSRHADDKEDDWGIFEVDPTNIPFDKIKIAEKIDISRANMFAAISGTITPTVTVEASYVFNVYEPLIFFKATHRFEYDALLQVGFNKDFTPKHHKDIGKPFRMHKLDENRDEKGFHLYFINESVPIPQCPVLTAGFKMGLFIDPKIEAEVVLGLHIQASEDKTHIYRLDKNNIGRLGEWWKGNGPEPETSSCEIELDGSLTGSVWAGLMAAINVGVGTDKCGMKEELSARIGPYIEGKLNLDFMDLNKDMSWYSGLKDSKIKRGIKSAFNLDFTAKMPKVFSYKWTQLELSPPKLFFEQDCYLLPAFEAPTYSVQGNSLKCYTSVTRSTVPNHIGLRVKDESGKEVTKWQNFTFDFADKDNPYVISETFDNLDFANHRYTIIPVTRIWELPALEIPEPSQTCVTCPDSRHPHLIDLGLPSGTKWLCQNVYADDPKDAGGYYQWGKPFMVHAYTDLTYRAPSSAMANYQSSEHDAATANLGQEYCTPTMSQFNELHDNCSMDYKYSPWGNNVLGVFLKGKNGNNLYLPFSGFKSGVKVNNKSEGCFLSSDAVDSDNNLQRKAVVIKNNDAIWHSTDALAYGYSVRPVSAGSDGLVIEPQQLDYEVIVGQKVGQSVTVTNNGSSPVSVTVAQTNAPFQVDDACLGTFTVKPKERLSVLVNFSPTEVKEYTSFLNLSYLSGNACVVSKVPLKGKGIDPNISHLQLSTTTLTLPSGSQGTVEVTSGSGGYAAVSNTTNVATVTVEGSKLIITGVAQGTATITVKDNQTQERAKIEVTVSEAGSFNGQIVMERKYLIHHNNIYNYPTVMFHFDYDDRGLVLGYFDTDYYEGYGKKLQGIHLFSVKDGGDGTNYHEKKYHTKEWYIAPVVLDQWVKEKIVINHDGRIQYYMNDQYMGEEVFDQLPLIEAKTIRISISPWGWGTGMFEYMDDFTLTTPAASISDDFNDGVINTKIWRAPVNPDGVREEDGIIKMEQLRTDQDFNMYTLPIPIGDGKGRITVTPQKLDFGEVEVVSSESRYLTIVNNGSEQENVNLEVGDPFGLSYPQGPNGGGRYRNSFELSLAPEELEIIEVHFNPTSANSCNSEIKVTSNGVSGGVFVVPVYGTGIQVQGFHLSEKSVESYVNVYTDVYIYNGSGDYEIINNYPDIVEAAIGRIKPSFEYFCGITGKKVGKAVLKVKDKQTSEALTLNVEVKRAPSLLLSAKTVEVPMGEYNSSIEIQSGSGWYNISSDNPEIATASKYYKSVSWVDENGEAHGGTFIKIEGLKSGSTIVRVKDMSSGETATINVIVTGDDTPVAYLSCPDANHPHLIDLGLPSGTKWACCNVGANSSEDYGDYFAWGETEPKNVYNWSTYKYCKGSQKTLTKYCPYSDYVDFGYNGFTDSLQELLLEDDAASANWGHDWQMPSLAQMEELIDESNTTKEWTTQNNVNGFKITSKRNGGCIFLPAAGSYVSKPQYPERTLSYWSRSLYTRESPDANIEAYNMGYMSSLQCGSHYRYIGRSIRPVRRQGVVTDIMLSKKSIGLQPNDTYHLAATVLPEDADNKVLIWESNNEAIANVSNDGKVVPGGSAGMCVITCRASDGSGVYAECQVKVSYPVTAPENMEAIDLGLPSGTLWANMNIGANCPEDYGLYFAWGETVGYDNSEDHSFDKESYKWCWDGHRFMTKYCTDSQIGIVDNKTVLDLEDDAAHVNWGGNWRMPTAEEWQELIDNCDLSWVYFGELRRFTSKINGKSIMLPMTSSGYFGHYWSSSLLESNPSIAYELRMRYDYSPEFQLTVVQAYLSDRWKGQSVRPVLNPNGKTDYQDGGNPSDGDGRPDTPGPDADDQGDL